VGGPWRVTLVVGRFTLVLMGSNVVGLNKHDRYKQSNPICVEYIQNFARVTGIEPPEIFASSMVYSYNEPTK
jgi:hypothetical protein